MGTEIFKFDEEMTEKMKHEVANPPQKKGKILYNFTAKNRSAIFR